MVTQSLVTPSGRDFRVYRLVKVECQPLVEIAAALETSEREAAQAVARVTEHLLATARPDDEEENKRRRGIGLKIAAQRMDHLFGMAMESYRASIGDHKIVRTVAVGGRAPVTTTTVKSSLGEGRYLDLAARLSLAATRLKGTMIELGFGEEDEAPTEYSEAAEELYRTFGGCSGQADETPEEAASQPAKSSASDSHVVAYVKDLLAKSNGERAFSSPVQTHSRANDSTNHKLSRKKRRDRQKLLEQAS